MIEPTKRDTHIVISQKALEIGLSDSQRMRFVELAMMATLNYGIKTGDKAEKSYYICNTDEPYAETVLSAILWGEGELSCEQCVNYGKHDDEVCYMCVHCEAFGDHFERKETS